MKIYRTHIIIVLCLSGSFGPLFSQVKVGLKAGVGSYDFGLEESFTVQLRSEEYVLAVQDSKLALHGGLFFQILLGSFVIQPEFLYNTHSVDYEFDLNNSTNPNSFNEQTTFVDIPLLFGLKAGPIRINGGAIGHYFLDNESDFDQFEEYEANFEDLTYGWQAGLGIDIFNLMIDVRYEGNLGRYNEHFNFENIDYAFSQRPSRLLASIAFSIN